MSQTTKIFSQFRYNSQANACYIKINDNQIIDTIPKSKDTFVDIDKDGKIVGIEIINVNNHSNIINSILFTDKDFELCL